MSAPLPGRADWQRWRGRPPSIERRSSWGGGTKDGPSSYPSLREEEIQANCPLSVGQFCQFPVASFPSSDQGGQNRKGMRPLLGCCWPATAGRRWLPRCGEARGLGRGREAGACLGVAAPVGAVEPRHPDARCWRGAAHPAQPCLTSRRAALTATPWVGSGPGRALRRVIKEPGEEAGPPRPSPAHWPIRRRVGGPAVSTPRRQGAAKGRRTAGRWPGGVISRLHRRIRGTGSWRAGLYPGVEPRPSLLSVCPHVCKQVVVKRKCVGHSTTRMSSSSELLAEQGGKHR